MTPRILVVEDEAHLAEGIRDNLLAEGYDVKIAEDGELALSHFDTYDPHLIVLDVMLPKRDGYAVCKTIRDRGGITPILFLTAKNTEEDRITGFDVGADDYLGKPFALRELLLRVKAMLRRQTWYSAMPKAGQHLELAGHSVDFSSYEVTSPSGICEVFSQKEIMILKFLVEKSNEVVSRDEILDRVWGYDVFPSSRTIDNFIVRLRKRFEADPEGPIYFHTIRGVGYRFTPKGKLSQ